MLFFFLCLFVCRVCETGSDHQPLSDSQQTNCEYFVDSLFEEAQKVGAKCLSPTEQKKQVSVHKSFLSWCFSKYGPLEVKTVFVLIVRYYLLFSLYWVCTDIAKAMVNKTGSSGGTEAVAPHSTSNYCTLFLALEGSEKWKETESEVAQSCLTLCDPVDCSPPRSSVHGILQARILEWVAISFSRGSSRPRGWTQISRIVGRRFNLWATREAPTLLSALEGSEKH